ncbi:hypothetical protein ACELLULO517_07435 [Acidisoma cellulosilytica]|uniref:Uncharacterized protein n=1 Tax=Acidisoma cellulosilyticum TaxID=2802395 RepID=A0A963Z136_9PROT|nr:hypothetical protein [Acidisoma cellulosilyticum]MCB8880062.1 hypothetical protein [Acidisoma cellulosilyticum]
MVGLLLASVLLYVAAFSVLLDRPLSLGTLRETLERKIAAASAMPPPRLIILAGSNALFSHSCATIGAMLALPCVNGGVALGLGLDYQFALWKPVLRPGDNLYLPMELEQYARPLGAARTGPDAALVLQQDRFLLVHLGIGRVLPALFSGTMSDAVASVVEQAAVAFRPDLANPAFSDINGQGDGIGHSLLKARANRVFLASLHRQDPSPAVIRDGYGRQEIAAFLHWARRHGVQVIGGFPTEFADNPSEPALGATLAAIYTAEGARFLPLAGEGRYPRADFFDAQDHLMTECQMRHSIRVADALAPFLGRAIQPPPAGATLLAANCP